VRIEYELAGVASRIGALIIDTLLQVALIALIVLLGIILQFGTAWLSSTWAPALLGVAGFAIYYGYFVFFEYAWNGQTPGKRYARMRVIREGGLPMDLASAAIRNLIRVVEVNTVVIGLISVLVSSKNQRLGDLAAGTLVVKERAEWVGHLQAAPHAAPESQHPEAALVKNIELVTPEEFDAVKRFVERKAELGKDVREQLAARIAQPLTTRLGIETVPGISYSNLLSAIYSKCIEDRGMR
jgi:uncharacterized RDD family membrane protein YckC